MPQSFLSDVAFLLLYAGCLTQRLACRASLGTFIFDGFLFYRPTHPNPPRPLPHPAPAPRLVFRGPECFTGTGTPQHVIFRQDMMSQDFAALKPSKDAVTQCQRATFPIQSSSRPLHTLSNFATPTSRSNPCLRVSLASS